MIITPYLLRHENIAHIEGGNLYIGDRRAYPFKEEFVRCSTIEEVALALQQMVTQGGGPLEVALAAMRLVRIQIREGRALPALSTFRSAAETLSTARPTNTTMKRTLSRLLAPYRTLDDAMDLIEEDVAALLDEWDAIYHQMGRSGSTLLSDGSRVLTTCFGEHTLLYTLAYAREAGKAVTLYVNETRPYLQGSRLTAPSAHEMGIEVTIIGDGMGANLMREGMIDMYMSACDVLCMDGTVVNKVGTRSNAIAACYHNLPYYAYAISPDPSKDDSSALVMEERDPQEMKECLGQATTIDGVGAYYPAFDIIEADLVTGLVTPKGILKPAEIKEHFA